MYIYYLIRMDFEDGNWGYVRWDTGGRFSITRDPNDCLVFDSHDEAQEYYYQRWGRNTTVNGSRIKSVYITKISSGHPM